MPHTLIQPSLFQGIQKQVNNKPNVLRAAFKLVLVSGFVLSFLAALLFLLSITGCGAGGYAGGGIEAMSASAITLDAGQSYKFTTTVNGTPTVTYSLSGSCGSGSSCGNMSNTTGTTVVYTAPTGITSQIMVTLTAAVTGTKSEGAVAITVNPDPKLAAIPSTGTVGTPYTGSLSPSGGTTPLTLSVATGSLPPGLNLNVTTGAITGTPTSAGTFNFTAQLTDSSAVPYLLTTQETITISAPAASPITLSGNPPAGTVGSAYSTSFVATGGIAPYTFSLLSGSLPTGLALSPAGVIAGTPTMQGVSVFTLQAQDSAGNKATAAFSITINSQSLSLTLSTLPNGTVNVPYSSTIGVTGGTAPYSCTIVSGTLQAGLTLTGCLVSGTPTASGTVNLMVKATDSSNPQETTTGPVSLTINPAGSLTLMSPPAGTVNTPYTGTIGVSGGSAPYSCMITAGTLPAGLTISNCTITGTPTTAGTTTLTVKGTDSSNPVLTTTGPVVLVIHPSALSLTLSTLPNGTVNIPYSSTIGVTGGTAPYSCTIVSGTLQAGLTLTGCLVSGTPTVASTVNLMVKATDSSNPQESTTGPVSLTINPAGTLTLTSPPAGTVSAPYTGTIGVLGGTAPYSCMITAGMLPAGLTISNCTITGTPTTPGTTTITVKGTDSGNPTKTTTGPVTIVINPSALMLTLSTLPNGTINVPYSSTIGVSGGTAPYSCTITSGTLQAGLTLTGCLVSGTPTVAGTVNLMVKATDSSNPQESTTGPVSLTINPAALSLAVSSLPNGTVDVAYSQTIGVTGGKAPYTCAITSNNLPAGLSVSGCLVSGTPATAGTVILTVKATDSSNPQETTTGPVSLTINPAGSLALSSPPSGTANTPYTGTIGVSGGTAPYTCTINAGTLPAGLSISNCTITGTPTTPGTTTLTVTGTDFSAPTKLTTTGPVTLVIAPGTLTLTLSSLPNGTVNVPYSQTIGVSGGTAPYSCTITSGTLQAGLTLTGCLVSGTPTVASTVNLMVKATDSSNPQESTTGPVSLTINPAALTLTLSTLPNGTVNVPYSQTIGVSGGTSPYSCVITNGTLPAGLSLSASGCLVSGTPTVAGTVKLTVKATDSSNPQETTTGPVSLTINPAAATLTLTSPPAGTVNTPYTGTIGVRGGTAPYSCLITAGTLPAGLSISNCTISGTPTTAGSTTLTVKATDSSSPVVTTTGPVTLVINPAAAMLTITSPPAATVDTPYTGPIGVSGGTAPYSCTEVGTLPAGLTLTSAGCVITGTPTTAGSTTVTVTATGSGTNPATGTGPVTITVNALSTLTFTGALPNAIQNVAYAQTLTAQGGLPPYKYTLTAGTLPPGIALSTNSETPDGAVFSGTPTVVGLSGFTVTVTDSEPTPQSVALPLTLLVQYPTGPNDSYLMGPYAYLFQGYDNAILGVLAYKTATVGSFAADGLGGISAGEMDANHQSSNPTGNTISSENFVGTYTIGSDDRGKLMIIALHGDGTIGASSTYDIAVQAPIAPATISVEGNLVEYDAGTVTAGTEGSGTFLAQTSTAFSAGLNGSYAFGISGDEACAISCSVNLLLGSPVGTVGAFTANGEAADGGSITGGSSDTNIATTDTSNSQLSGTYTTADQNGRIGLSMTADNITNDLYPTDYAVYMVDSNRAFILSTDKHSNYILLSGSAQLQTPSFLSGSTAISGPFVGYENSAPDPGLLSVTLQQLLNLTTATIFEGSSTANGCNIASVTIGGVTGLTNALGSVVGLSTLIGNYESTGNVNCSVAANGRGVLDYPTPGGLLSPILILLGLDNPPPPRVFYLSSQNTGYFLETGYAAVGKLEAQTGEPFTIANTFTGNYVFASTPPGSAVSINGTGVVHSNGTGSAQVTEDSVIQVGDLNILTLGTATTEPYGPINSTTGVFPLGPYTVYTIDPSRFVLVDPSLTSPSVSVLY